MVLSSMTNYIPPKGLKNPQSKYMSKGDIAALTLVVSPLLLIMGAFFLYVSSFTESLATACLFIVPGAISLMFGFFVITYAVLSLTKLNVVPQENKELAQAKSELQEALKAQHGIGISLEHAQSLLFQETISLPGNVTKWIKLNPDTGVFTVTTKTVTTEELTISQNAVLAAAEPKKVLPQELFA
jgi:hypothetical protein